MTLTDLENYVIKSFCTLDVTPFIMAEESAFYSNYFKDEMIVLFQELFDKYKAKGINNLVVKDSKCLHCYPDSNAYSFHHPKTDEFLIRYVISQKDPNLFIVEECRNKIIPDIWKSLNL